jgi:PhzF family phenazine biosynthesis protein
MGLPIVQVDAFTDRPFAGNPAAICLLDGPAEDQWMQAVAAEMNQPETAFLEALPTGAPDGAAAGDADPGGASADGPTWRLRWFTPVCEVELCGHATLASAHHLLTDLGVDPGGAPLRFVTLSGVLTARPLRDGWIQLDFPVDHPVETEAPDGLLEALGVEKALTVARGRSDWLVEVPCPEEVRGVRPDMDALMALGDGGRGVILTSVGEGLHDVVSRFFAPAAGIPEDPVTGSAHTTLAPFWAERLGKDDFLAYQASARGGTVEVSLRGDRVLLGGQAVTVLRGELDDDLLAAVVSRRAAGNGNGNGNA